MNDVVVLKAANHVYNGIDFADVAQKLVAQTFAFGGTLYQTGNVHKFQRCRCELVWFIHFCQFVQTSVRHRNDTHIFFNGAERIVCGFCSGICQSIEQRAFSHIGQPDHT